MDGVERGYQAAAETATYCECGNRATWIATENPQVFVFHDFGLCDRCEAELRAVRMLQRLTVRRVA